MKLLIVKFSEMGAVTEKRQFGLGYCQNRPLQILVSLY